MSHKEILAVLTNGKEPSKTNPLPKQCMTIHTADSQKYTTHIRDLNEHTLAIQFGLGILILDHENITKIAVSSKPA